MKKTQKLFSENGYEIKGTVYRELVCYKEKNMPWEIKCTLEAEFGDSYKKWDDMYLNSAKVWKVIGDFEIISDHGVNILESAEELKDKNIRFSPGAKKEMDVLCSAVAEILTLSYSAFIHNDLDTARNVEPLEQVIDRPKTSLRNAHIARLKNGECSVEAGFVWADLITNLERTADHCSNIAVCIILDSQKFMPPYQ